MLKLGSKKKKKKTTRIWRTIKE